MALRNPSRWVLCAALALSTACGTGTDTEDDLIPDSELASLKSEPLVSVEAKPEAALPAYRVRLAWGFLAGNKGLGRGKDLKAKNKDQKLGWTDWTGSAIASDGTLTKLSVGWFEGSDRVTATDSAARVNWTSHTLPHFDTLTLLGAAASADGVVNISMPLFKESIPAAQLAAGLERHATVDAAGHEVSISSLPAGACGGFALGYVKPSSTGEFTAIAGRILDADGKITGTLRLKAVDGALTGKWLDMSGEKKADAVGTLKDGAFAVELKTAEGAAFATVSGLTHDASYSDRGSFQGTWRCP